MKITFVTDYVCPFCIVAKEAFKAASSELGITPEFITQPFQLTTEGHKRVDTVNDPVRRSHYTCLFEPAKALGLDAKLPPNIVPRPYTKLAFEGYYFASEYGKGDEYSDVMYHAYFCDEKDIGEIDVILEEAEKIGLDSALLRTAIESGKYSDVLKEADKYAKTELDVHSVPTIYIDGKKISMTNFSKESAIKVLKENM